MFVGITNTPRDYAWGSRTAISSLLGREPSGGPEAELWLGTHPGSPSVVVDPSSAGGAATLDRVTTLPFLLKVLAADAPLSLQAHPNLEQAREGFERENAVGVPLDAPSRNYKDPLHKPELVYALSEEYHALCGFRPVIATRALLASVGSDPLVDDLLSRLVDDASLPAVFEWIMTRGDGVDELIERVVALAASVSGLEFETVGELAAAYPGDPGILISLLMNRVVLSRGEVLYLPAGNIHAYLRGLGIELMSASDNVLRGGLTPKYVDVPELLSVLDFTPLPVPILAPEHPAPGVSVFRPDVPDFTLTVLLRGGTENEGDPTVLAFENDSIALCLAGLLQFRTSSGGHTLARGEAAFVSADESPWTIDGDGMLFVASGVRQ